MSRGKNAYLQKQTQIRNALMHQTELLTQQFMVDMLIIAIHQTEGWGYDRIMRLLEAWREVRHEYKPAMNPHDPEADVYQEHMDRIMVQIINGKQELIPFKERYPELREVRY